MSACWGGGPECPDLREVLVLGGPRWQELVGTPIDATALTQVAATLHAQDPINI